MYCWFCETPVAIILDASQSEWHLGKPLLSTENEYQNAVPFGMLSMVMSPSLSFTNDATVTLL